MNFLQSIVPTTIMHVAAGILGVPPQSIQEQSVL